MATVNPVVNQGMNAFQDTTNFIQNNKNQRFQLEQQQQQELERRAVDAAIRNAYTQSRQPVATPQSMLNEQAVGGSTPAPIQGVQRQQLDAPAGYVQQTAPMSGIEQVSAKAPVPAPMTPQNFQEMLARTAAQPAGAQATPSYQPILERAVGEASSPPPTPVNQQVSQSAVPTYKQIDPQTQQRAQPQQQMTSLSGQSYNQALSQNLANTPGGGALLDKAQAQQDKDIASVLEMAANGHVEEARYVAQQRGIQIPEEILGNADMSRAMSMANTAYPAEPDKGQKFFMAFIQGSGTTRDRVLAGIRAAGPPDNASQRALANSIALADYNAKNKPPVQYIGPDGVLTNVAGGTATPVVDQNGQPFKPTTGAGGKSLGGSSSSRRFVAVAGTGLVDTMAEGGPKVIVPAGQAFNVEEATQKIYLEMIGDISNAGRPQSELLQEARNVAQQIWSSNAGGLTGTGAAPAAPTAGTVLQPQAQAPAASGLSAQTVSAPAAQTDPSQKVRVRYNGKILEIDRSDLPAAQQNGAILING